MVDASLLQYSYCCSSSNLVSMSELCLYIHVGWFLPCRPPGDCYQSFRTQFMLFSCVLSKLSSSHCILLAGQSCSCNWLLFQSCICTVVVITAIFFIAFVMLLQFRYQRAKLYRQVAMGKKHHLSVSQGRQCISENRLMQLIAF